MIFLWGFSTQYNYLLLHQGYCNYKKIFKHIKTGYDNISSCQSVSHVNIVSDAISGNSVVNESIYENSMLHCGNVVNMSHNALTRHREVALPWKSSGAAYGGLPQKVSSLLPTVKLLLNPKSAIFMFISASNSRFSALRSLCTMFFWWQYCTEDTIYQGTKAMCQIKKSCL